MLTALLVEPLRQVRFIESRRRPTRDDARPTVHALRELLERGLVAKRLLSPTKELADVAGMSPFELVCVRDGPFVSGSKGVGVRSIEVSLSEAATPESIEIVQTPDSLVSMIIKNNRRSEL